LPSWHSEAQVDILFPICWSKNARRTGHGAPKKGQSRRALRTQSRKGTRRRSSYKSAPVNRIRRRRSLPQVQVEIRTEKRTTSRAFFMIFLNGSAALTAGNRVWASGSAPPRIFSMMLPPGRNRPCRLNLGNKATLQIGCPSPPPAVRTTGHIPRPPKLDLRAVQRGAEGTDQPPLPCAKPF